MDGHRLALKKKILLYFKDEYGGVQKTIYYEFPNGLSIPSMFKYVPVTKYPHLFHRKKAKKMIELFVGDSLLKETDNKKYSIINNLLSVMSKQKIKISFKVVYYCKYEQRWFPILVHNE